MVVTGGTGALGTAVVGALLEAGATCHVPYRSEDEAQRFPHRAHKSVTLTALGDLADEAAVNAFYGGIARALGLDPYRGRLRLRADREERQGAADGADRKQSRVGLSVQPRGGERLPPGRHGGRIVNVAARPALEPRSGASMTAYTATKAGLAGFTQALAEEVAKDGILVNAVAPSIMDTPANRAAMPKADFAAWPKVEEVAATILFLASPENAVTRGAIVPVYGKS